MQKIVKIFKPNVVFFLLLYVFLFLGDGKQAIIDVAGIAMVLFLYLSHGLYGRRATDPPTSLLERVWVLLLVYLALTTAFSISAGFSISSFIRYLMAYLVFVYFYSSSESQRGFGKLLLWFGAVAALTSFVAVTIEAVGRALPSMNLLYPVYGHNHVVDLIVFGLPLAIAYAQQKRGLLSSLLLVLYVAALIFSFSRGAVLLIAGYVLFLVVRRGLRIKPGWVLGILVVACVAGSVIFAFRGAWKIHFTSFITRQVFKASIIESRVPYWKQALLAFRERPLFGAGPGTFYLLSKQYQDGPARYSWFAHSYLLETAAELGIVGVGLVIILLGTIFRLIVRELPQRAFITERRALFDGALLTLVYGLFEFSLNFLIIWLLFWATLGALLNNHRKQDKTKRTTQPVALVLIGLYYAFSFGSIAAETVTHNTQLAALIEPYNVDTVIRATKLSTNNRTSLPVWLQGSFLVFHSGNPEAMMSLAQYTSSRHAPVWTWYQKAVDADPQNTYYLTQYVSALLNSNEKTRIGRLLETKGQRTLPISSWGVLQSVDWQSLTITSLFTEKLFEDVGQPTRLTEYLSKTYYFLGFSLLNSDPTTTRNLWTLARDVSPGWGYFHVELARLEFLYFHNYGRAQDVLNYCKKFIEARIQCEHTIIRDFSVRVSQYDQIKSIPSVR